MDGCYMQELNLGIGEAREVVIHAAPHALGPATATLLCEVAGNPATLELALACTGALPLMELHVLAEDAVVTGNWLTTCGRLCMLFMLLQ